MAKTQAPPHPQARFRLQSERLGPLPLINYFLERLDLEALLAKYVPMGNRRSLVAPVRALGVLLRSIIVEREPIYRQEETAQQFASTAFGLTPGELEHIGDDRIGRALDRLFDADRAALLTELAVRVGQRFGVSFDELHNDSTSVSFCGQYPVAGRRKLRGQRTLAITYGYSKDYRPDLKQLLFVLTTADDGGVPVSFRAADGNTSDSVTHIDTWNTLRTIAGRADFLYVADSKLASRDNLAYINRAGGRFITVLPRTREEDRLFRRQIQTAAPDWELVWDRACPYDAEGPRDCWHVCRAGLPSIEGWSVIWVWSTLASLQHGARRLRQLAAASTALQELRTKLANNKGRRRGAKELDQKVATILEHYQVKRYLKVQRIVLEEHVFKQARRGRPSADMSYRRITKRRYDLKWTKDDAAIAYDQKSDGMWPLLTNDAKLTPAQVLHAYKGQPKIEKRFEQLKTVHEIAPVLLKNEGRIEALFTLYFIGLLVAALIERELRRAMHREHIGELPLYPEQRRCKHPTAEQVFRLFSYTQRHRLLQQDVVIQTFNTELTDLQRQILSLLGVPIRTYDWSG